MSPTSRARHPSHPNLRRRRLRRRVFCVVVVSTTLLLAVKDIVVFCIVVVESPRGNVAFSRPRARTPPRHRSGYNHHHQSRLASTKTRARARDVFLMDGRGYTHTGYTHRVHTHTHTHTHTCASVTLSTPNGATRVCITYYTPRNPMCVCACTIHHHHVCTRRASPLVTIGQSSRACPPPRPKPKTISHIEGSGGWSPVEVKISSSTAGAFKRER